MTPGKPGRSGGAREGAGRKPRTFRLKLGDRLFTTQVVGGIATDLGRQVEVTETSRSRLILTIRDGDGPPEEIRFIR